MENDEQKAKSKRSALGRGLSALISAPVAVSPARVRGFGESGPKTDISEYRYEGSNNTALEVNSNEINELGVSYLPITSIQPNPKQPRHHFDSAELAELTNSIATLGVLQPVLVRKTSVNGRYQIIAGERRWRAAGEAKLSQIPVVIRDFNDRETLEVALVENLQRSNLNPVEEARAYQQLADEFTLTQQEIAERVGKDRVSVANSMRLLKLSEEVLTLCEKGELSMGHARSLLSIKDGQAQLRLAKKAIAEQLSVRELESLVARAVVLDAGKVASAGTQISDKQSAANKWAEFSEVVDRLRNALGTKVNIRHQQSGKGRVEIEYFSEDELDRLVDRICGSEVTTN
jgi:ParB family transcriptional regulator, chromosome partitioning protein